ncbi:N-acetyltransferase family protein [Mesorhizobium sp. CAU 1732]|uniref:GNAT family N-acetyltransferase n=1 Tax=Mesorhizobium sp. CAU 1732 TaxID=3140358 RepID=UPI00326053CE
MNEPAIRPATSGDLDAITEIYADAVLSGTASYELEPPSRAEMEVRFRTLSDGGYPYIVADMEGSVLGYAYAGAFRPRPAYRFIVENSVYVSPQAKGRGIGLALMRRLIQEVEALGFRQMIAVIGDGHPQSASVKLHAKLGFQPSGILEGTGYKHGKWLDTAFMQLSLNGGRTLPPDPDSLPERNFRRR